MRTGPDGRIYVAQVSGSQISAIDLSTGIIEAVSPKGGEIVAPDDIVFDDEGNLYATEITEGRVSMRTPAGVVRVLQGDMIAANPITIHNGRLIAGECRPGGRILELDRDGGAPRVILENVPLPNAFEVGPDGDLYVPVMGANEIWRVPLAGGSHEVVARGLGVPDAVKFDARGRIVSTQVASGQVLRIDPRTGASEVLAQSQPGLDNVTFVGERIIVSSISGRIEEVLPDGRLRSIVPDGFNWPLGLAMDPSGDLFVADGPFSYWLCQRGERRVAGMLFTPGVPGYVRGAASGGHGELVVTTSLGHVARWWPERRESEFLAAGFDQLYGVAVSGDGAIVFAEKGSGKVHAARDGEVEVLASGLDQPCGVAIDGDGHVYVTESASGCVVRLDDGWIDPVADGFDCPQGVAVSGSRLVVVDSGAKTLTEIDLVSRTRSVIAEGLPVGAPAGIVPKSLGPIGDMSGPMGPFAGVAIGRDGAIFVSADAEGSVLAVRRDPGSRRAG